MKTLPDQTLFFDDCYKDVLTYAYPIVKNYPYPKVLGVITSMVGKNITHTKRYGNRVLPVLSKKEIRFLLSKGWQIASHTVSHKHFSQMPLDEVVYEMVASRKWIKKIFGVKPICFVFPYTDFTEEQYETALQIYSCVRSKKQSLGPYVFHDFITNHERKRLVRIIKENIGG